jgi:3D (Asp-Asp-Asp) domain-containing protein
LHKKEKGKMKKTPTIVMIFLIVFSAFSILAPKVKANDELGSLSPPVGYTPKVPDEINGSATALLIEDVVPWAYDSDALALSQLGISYDLTHSWNLQSVNLAEYKFIILASDQPTSTYVNIANNIAQIDSYVSNGGVYVVHACDEGWSAGDWSGLQIMPRGVTHVTGYYTMYIHIIDQQSPVVAGLDDAYFAGWGYSAHGYFTNVPPDADVVMVTETYLGSGVQDPNKPTYMVYSYGSGKVLATMQTIEWGWGGVYNWVGGFRKEFLLNEITYAQTLVAVPAIRYMITTDHVKVRGTPGKPDDTNVITMLPKGSLLQIVEHVDNGKYADGYHWWYVKFGTGSTDGVLTGWVAEEFLAEYKFPKEPKERKDVKFTAYNVVSETEVIKKVESGEWVYPTQFNALGTAKVKVKIYPAGKYWPGQEIGEEEREYNRAFLYSNRGVCMQGSGRDKEERLIKCRALKVGAFTWKEGWIEDESKIEFYEVQDWPLFPRDASVGANGYISPWRSIAVKGYGGVVPLGSIVYVPELKGKKLSNGAVLDGYFVAQDTGNLEEDQIDVFVGEGEIAMEDYREIVKERLDIIYYETKWPLKQAKLDSPGELRVYDSQGRVTGLVNGEIKIEIPYSSYDYVDDVVTIAFPADPFRYVVVGTGEEQYNLTLISVTEQETITFVAIDIPTLANSIHQYTVDWAALSVGEEGVTVQIDSDGDGVFDHIFTADNELTHDEFMLQTATTVDFDPDTLNLGSEGKWVTVYIELPEDYDISRIVVSSIMLNGTVPALAKPTEIGDCDGDGIPDLMVKFDRASVITLFDGKTVPGNYVIDVTGTWAYIRFKGTITIKVISPP